MKFHIFFFLALALVFDANAQHKLSGIVSNTNGEPLAGAHVSIENHGIVTSDKNGFYHFHTLATGIHIVKTSYTGFISRFDTLDIKQSMVYDVTLRHYAQLMDEVIVKATRTGMLASPSVSSLTKEDINKENLGQDIPILLGQLPSLLTTSDAGSGIGYSGISIRGTDPSRINVTINGIALNDPESQGVFWVDIPDFASSLENIQVGRGVGFSTNGAGSFGATINLQTQAPRAKSYAGLFNSGGSFNTHKHMAKFGTGLINDRFSIDGRISGIWSDGYVDRAFSKLHSFFLSASYYDKNFLLKALLFSGRETTYQAWYGVPEDLLETNRTYNYYTYENEIDRYGQDHYQLHASTQLNPSWRLTGALHYTKGAGYYEQFREDDAFSDYGVANPVVGNDTITETNLIRRRWLDNDYYGFTFSSDWIMAKSATLIAGLACNNYDGEHFGEVIWAEHASNFPHKFNYYDNTGKKTDGNMFTKLNLAFSEKTSLTADMQLRKVNYEVAGTDNDQRQLSTEANLLFFNPKIGIQRTIGKSIMSLFAGIANREPARNDYIDAPAGRIPSPERLYNVELGFVSGIKNLDIKGNLYIMYYKNQLVLTGELNDVGTPIRENVKESYRAGIELVADWLISNKLAWQMNATISTNKINQFDELVYVYDENFDLAGTEIIKHKQTDISFSPALIAGSRLMYIPFRWLKCSLLSKYAGSQYLDNTSSSDRKIAAYLVHDMLIAIMIKSTVAKEISMTAKVANLLDSDYETNGYTFGWINEDANQVRSREFYNYYYPQAGRFYLVGLNVSF